MNRLFFANSFFNAQLAESRTDITFYDIDIPVLNIVLSALSLGHISDLLAVRAKSEDIILISKKKRIVAFNPVRPIIGRRGHRVVILIIPEYPVHVFSEIETSPVGEPVAMPVPIHVTVPHKVFSLRRNTPHPVFRGKDGSTGSVQ